jgi:transcriptional regulator with XRE-family HTH domain
MPKVSRFKLSPVDFGGETLGERIARIRKERGFTQVELASRIGIIQTIISATESDGRKLSAEMAVRFAQALDVSMDELLGPGRTSKRGRKPSRKILRRLEKIETLPRTQQTAVLKTIDNALELHLLKTGTR